MLKVNELSFLVAKFWINLASSVGVALLLPCVSTFKMINIYNPKCPKHFQQQEKPKAKGISLADSTLPITSNRQFK